MKFILKCIETIKYLLGYHKYLFADLDDTIIHTKSGKKFPIDKNDFIIDGNVVNAIHNYNPDYLYIVTNQGGIQLGYISWPDFNEKVQMITNQLTEYLNIPVICAVCAINDKSHPQRKPNPGMILDGIKDLKAKHYQCMMIGDASGKPGQFSDSDKKCAENAMIRYMDINDFVYEYN